MEAPRTIYEIARKVEKEVYDAKDIEKVVQEYKDKLRIVCCDN